MIFVTVGTQYPFDRLLSAVEHEIINGNINEEVIVQCGNTNFKSDKMKLVNYMDIDEFNKMIKKASLIISHAGVGTIIDALNMGKTIIVAPRLSKYKEAVNDHQLEILKKFSNLGYIIPLKDPNKLSQALKDAKIFKPKKYVSNTQNMVNLIENFIDNN